MSDRASIETLSSANAAGRIQRQHLSEQLSPQETTQNILALQTGQSSLQLYVVPAEVKWWRGANGCSLATFQIQNIEFIHL